MQRLLHLRDPFELFLAYLCFGAGLTYTFSSKSVPNSALTIMPWWLVHIWGATLAIGGALTFVGLLARRHQETSIKRIVMGLRLEGGGLYCIGAGCCVIAVGIVLLGGWKGLFAAGTDLALTFACLVRLLEVRKIEAALIAAMKRNEPSHD